MSTIFNHFAEFRCTDFKKIDFSTVLKRNSHSLVDTRVPIETRRVWRAVGWFFLWNVLLSSIFRRAKLYRWKGPRLKESPLVSIAEKEYTVTVFRLSSLHLTWMLRPILLSIAGDYLFFGWTEVSQLSEPTAANESIPSLVKTFYVYTRNLKSHFYL